MKQFIHKPKKPLVAGVCILAMLMMIGSAGYAQADSAAPAQTKPKPRLAKNTFASSQIIDAQTVMVPVKGTFEADIQHRFGTVQNGYQDLWGIYASADIRIGFLYTPIDNLEVGFGLTKTNLLWDGSAKYAILRQTQNDQMPVSVTYYGNIAVKTVANPGNALFTYNSQRWSFFNQIMVARKINDKFSAQVGFSMAHQNSVPGYYTKADTTNVVFKEQKFNMWAFNVCGRYKLTEGTTFIIDWEQPITKFPKDNPHPNFAFGFEFNTSGHCFQIFAGNYILLNPQQNSLYNKNNPFGYTDNGTKIPGGEFNIGFNITRLWNF